MYGLGLIGQEQGGEYLTYHFDFRGSTVALTDENAQVTERFQYSPYGLLIGGDASTTPFLFNGMYGVMTDASGLYYMRARYYNPEIRRFVNQDILLGDIFYGQTLNRYAFVTGQPVNYVDPFGLEVQYCCRPAEIAWGMVDHCWLKTDSIEAGMANVQGGVAGEEYDYIYITKVEVVDHSVGYIPTSCETIFDVDEQCVNEKLVIGRPLHRFWLLNNCQTFANGVLIQCQTFRLKLYKKPPGRWDDIDIFP